MNTNTLFLVAIGPVIGFWLYRGIGHFYRQKKSLVDYYVAYIIFLATLYVFCQFFGLMEAQ